MRSDLDVPMSVDRASGEPVRRQVSRQLRQAITDGLLRVGEPLPSSRILARRLGVARSTVVACYLELEGEGWLYSSHGSGTFVAGDASLVGDASELPAGPPVVAEAGPRLELRPGDLDPRLVATSAWRQGWRNVAPAGVPAPAAGAEALRTELASYLASSRGLRCRPAEIVVCAGTAEALLLLTMGLGWVGGTVAVEDPGYPPVRQLLPRLGVSATPLDVTVPADVPLRLAALDPRPRGVYLTPSHQFPLGHRMSVEQRTAVLDWAEQTGAVIVEDDYDGEFRYDIAPVPSMAGMRPDAGVVYLGTMSKVLDPGLRLAYLRVPPSSLPAVLEARDVLGPTVSVQVQQAVAQLARSGELARHIARVRRTYAERRKSLLAVLAALPGVEAVRGQEAGLHLVVELDPRLRSAPIVSSAAALGLRIADLDEFRSEPEPERPALVMSYSSCDSAGLRRAGEILRSCIEQNR